MLPRCFQLAVRARPAADAAQTAESDILIAEGALLPVKALDISFSVSGQVHSVEVENGQAVRTDQVLARLQDVPEADAALAKARQEVLDAQVALDDYKASGALNLARASWRSSSPTANTRMPATIIWMAAPMNAKRAWMKPRLT